MVRNTRSLRPARSLKKRVRAHGRRDDVFIRLELFNQVLSTYITIHANRDLT